MRQRKAVRDILKDAAAAVVGPCLIALGMVIFNIPNHIAPGGVSGLATALASVLPVRTGTISFLLNVPLLVAAFLVLGRRGFAKTAVATVLTSAFINWFPCFLPAYTGNVLMAAVFGGALMGIGVGVLFWRGISSGGTDLLSLMLQHSFPDMSLGKLLLAADGVVVLVAVLTFREVEVALYSVVAIVVTSRTIDSVMAGVNYAKVIYIITGRAEEMVQTLERESGRGVTLIPARGGYTGQERGMLMTVTRQNAVSATLRLIRRCDESAFVFVTNATEVHGEGFTVAGRAENTGKRKSARKAAAGGEAERLSASGERPEA